MVDQPGPPIFEEVQRELRERRAAAERLRRQGTTAVVDEWQREPGVYVKELDGMFAALTAEFRDRLKRSLGR